MARQEVLDALDRQKAQTEAAAAEQRKGEMQRAAESNERQRRTRDLARLIRSEVDVYVNRLVGTALEGKPFIDETPEAFLWGQQTPCSNILTVYYRRTNHARVQLIRFARLGDSDVVWVLTAACTEMVSGQGPTTAGTIDRGTYKLHEARAFALTAIASQIETVVEHVLRDAGLIP